MSFQKLSECGWKKWEHSFWNSQKVFPEYAFSFIGKDCWVYQAYRRLLNDWRHKSGSGEPANEKSIECACLRLDRIMKIASIVGARPQQFIKCTPFSRELRENYKQILVHIEQHHDHEMSDIFFEELGILEPDCNLGIESGNQGSRQGKCSLK